MKARKLSGKKISGTKFGRCTVAIYEDPRVWKRYVVVAKISTRIVGRYDTEDERDARRASAWGLKKLRRDQSCGRKA